MSIARRLQDPLAELVKIEPKAIGVGQYQHDVNQTHLARSLDAVVEDCVNAVGVDLNTASAALLRYVSGLSSTLSQNIVEFRNQNGPFRRREDLRKVPRLGDKTFEQAAGFLRIVNGDHPLDASAVHPEAYPVVERILRDTGKDIRELIGNGEFLRSLEAANYTDERFGLPTVTDILRELENPAATRGPSSGPPASRRASPTSPTSGRACPWKGWSPTSPTSAPSWTSVCTTTAWCTSRSCPTGLSRTRARW